MSTNPWGSGAPRGKSYPCGRSARPALPYGRTRVRLDPQYPTLTPGSSPALPQQQGLGKGHTINEASPGPGFPPAVEAKKGWDPASTETQALPSTKQRLVCTPNAPGGTPPPQACSGPDSSKATFPHPNPGSSFRFGLSPAHATLRDRPILELTAWTPGVQEHTLQSSRQPLLLKPCTKNHNRRLSR